MKKRKGTVEGSRQRVNVNFSAGGSVNRLQIAVTVAS